MTTRISIRNYDDSAHKIKISREDTSTAYIIRPGHDVELYVWEGNPIKITEMPIVKDKDDSSFFNNSFSWIGDTRIMILNAFAAAATAINFGAIIFFVVHKNDFKNNNIMPIWYLFMLLNGVLFVWNGLFVLRDYNMI